MRSEMEKYLSKKQIYIKKALAGRDRAVVLGAVLSFLPIPPACMMGVLFSVFNLFLLKYGNLNKSNQKVVLVSLIVGLLNSTVVAFLLAHLMSDFLMSLSEMNEVIIDMLNFNNLQPSENFDA
jgi:hypothetical protein